MVELVRPMHDAENSTLRLYCWPHRTTHEFGLKDVEKIVYALGADAADRGPDANRVPVEDFIPSCPNEVLDWADDAEVYAEHVEQGIECRERADG